MRDIYAYLNTIFERLLWTLCYWQYGDSAAVFRKRPIVTRKIIIIKMIRKGAVLHIDVLNQTVIVPMIPAHPSYPNNDMHNRRCHIIVTHFEKLSCPADSSLTGMKWIKMCLSAVLFHGYAPAFHESKKRASAVFVLLLAHRAKMAQSFAFLVAASEIVVERWRVDEGNDVAQAQA